MCYDNSKTTIEIFCSLHEIVVLTSKFFVTCLLNKQLTDCAESNLNIGKAKTGPVVRATPGMYIARIPLSKIQLLCQLSWRLKM